MTLNLKGKIFNLSSPLVMGILNITPDSFYDGGKYLSEKSILKRAEQILSEGAKIIDIGAYSSRPNAEHISESEELERIISALKPITKEFPEAIISLDTFRSEIAKTAVNDFDVAIINDISAGNFDKNMMPTIAKLNVAYIMMHMQGSPQNMQKSPHYENIVKEILIFFSNKIQEAKLLGINNLIIDPGFGFGKTIEHNYELLSQLDKFKITELPLLVGISRKSMIYKVLETSVENSLAGTISLNTVSLMKGANILRVHDVKEAVDCIKLYNLLN